MHSVAFAIIFAACLAETEVPPRLRLTVQICKFVKNLGVALFRSSGHDTVSLSRAVTASLLADASNYCRVPTVL